MDCPILKFHMAKAYVARLSGAGALGCESRLLFAKIAMAIWFQVSGGVIKIAIIWL